MAKVRCSVAIFATHITPSQSWLTAMSIQRLRACCLSPKLSSQQQQLSLTNAAVQASAQKCPLVVVLLVKNVDNVISDNHHFFRDPHVLVPPESETNLQGVLGLSSWLLTRCWVVTKATDGAMQGMPCARFGGDDDAPSHGTSIKAPLRIRSTNLAKPVLGSGLTRDTGRSQRLRFFLFMFHLNVHQYLHVNK